MRFTASIDIDRVKPEDVPRYTSIALDQIATILNNGIRPGDNFATNPLELTFSLADTDTALAHGLNRVPVGYIVVSKSAATVVYNGSSAWTSTLIYLRANVAATIKLFVF